MSSTDGDIERDVCEYHDLQEVIETLREISESMEEDAPAAAGFLDGVREDVREAKRMYRRECLKGRIQAEMVVPEDCAEANPETAGGCAGANGGEDGAE